MWVFFLNVELSGCLEDSLLQQESQTVGVVVKTTVHCWNLWHKLRKGVLDRISTSPDGSLSCARGAAEVKAQVSAPVTMNRKTRVCFAAPMAAYCT